SWCSPLRRLSLPRRLLPSPAARRPPLSGMHWVAATWIDINRVWMNLVGRTRWDVQGRELVDKRHSYLVTSNHQSWADILVLQYPSNRRMPILKLFLKQELIWVPVIGLCSWALAFPFTKRY